MDYKTPNYYAVLGVEKSASIEDIKKAFQQQAKTLHPDSGNQSPAAAAEFQRVKEAYDVLKDREQRGVYDKKLSMNIAHSYDPEELTRRAEEFRRAHQNRGTGAAGTHGPNGQARLVRLIEHLLRPRFLFVAAPVIGGISWWLTEKISPNTQVYDEYGDKVQAWFNPRALRWETPAPWDPLFQSNRHTLKSVPRRDVFLSVPPTAPLMAPPPPQAAAQGVGLAAGSGAGAAHTRAGHTGSVYSQPSTATSDSDDMSDASSTSDDMDAGSSSIARDDTGRAGRATGAGVGAGDAHGSMRDEMQVDTGQTAGTVRRPTAPSSGWTTARLAAVGGEILDSISGGGGGKGGTGGRAAPAEKGGGSGHVSRGAQPAHAGHAATTISTGHDARPPSSASASCPPPYDHPSNPRMDDPSSHTIMAHTPMATFSREVLPPPGTVIRSPRGIALR